MSAVTGDLMTRMSLAARSTRIEVQQALAKDPSPRILRTLANNPALHPSVAAQLFADSDLLVADALVQQAGLDDGFQERALANSELHGTLARNASISARTQGRLLEEGRLHHHALVRNPGLSPMHHHALATAGDVETRRTLARRPLLDTQAQLVLSRDEDPTVLEALAANRELTYEASRELIEHAELLQVMRELAKNPSLVLGDDLPVFVLRISRAAKEYFADSLKHIPRVTRKEFVPTYDGSLKELVVICETLGRD